MNCEEGYTRTVVSPPLDINQQCVRKQAYPSFWSSLHGCHAIVEKEASKGGDHIFTIYVCPHCGQFHVGRVR